MPNSETGKGKPLCAEFPSPKVHPGTHRVHTVRIPWYTHREAYIQECTTYKPHIGRHIYRGLPPT